MKTRFITSLFCLIFGNTFSQNSFFQNSDSIHKKKAICTNIAIGTTWFVSDLSLYSIWYSNYTSSKFHFFDDHKEWLQMDKVGHAYTANKLTSTVTSIYKWCGYSQKKSILFGSAIALGYQTTLEVFDGFSNGWGFSWTDMVANVSGTSIYAAQELLFKDQFFTLKFSDHSTSYAAIRPNILGKTIPERILKDYNGQTSWLSFSPFSFIHTNKKLDWLCLSFGYGINAKIDGKSNYYLDINSGISYFASRKFLFSFDINFNKIPIKNQRIKRILKPFNLLKIPFPTLIYMNNKLNFNGFYF